jgi:hypothetical protein
MTLRNTILPQLLADLQLSLQPFPASSNQRLTQPLYERNMATLFNDDEYAEEYSEDAERFCEGWVSVGGLQH